MTRLGRFFKEHAVFAAVFGAAYLIYLYPLFGFKSGAIYGDYEMQFYPFLKLYAAALKNGSIPLWTPLIQAGFPIFAEGQTGMLYLPNLVLFRIFSFDIAYNLTFLLHFLAGGIFAYLFALKRGISKEGATLTALAFTFGSAAAGAFYNVVTLRTLVWFPLALYLVERFLETKSIRPLVWLALIQAQSWLGGFPQTAAYHLGFVALYYGLRSIENPSRERSFGRHAAFAAALGLSVLVALPQIWATLELAGHSSRTLQDKDFALWGSMAPWSVVVVFLHGLTAVLRTNLYVGILPALLFLAVPKVRWMRAEWILFWVSVAMALGQFNPLYWVLLKLPLVSLLRNPSKFLFFTAFFMAVIAGRAFDDLFDEFRADAAWKKLFLARSRITAALVSAVAALAYGITHIGQSLLNRFGDWYVRAFVLGKSFHRDSPESYLERVGAMLSSLEKAASMENVFFWLPVVLVVFLAFFLAILLPKMKSSAAKTFLLVFTVVDLLAYSAFGVGTSFFGCIQPFPDYSRYESYPRDGRWLDVTREGIFPPNLNLSTGHGQVGAYSPLLDKDYYRMTADLGALDDSFGRTVFKIEKLAANRPLVDFLGVRYLVSGVPLDGFKLLRREGDAFIYENGRAHPEFSHSADQASIKIISESSGLSEIEVQAVSPGILTRNQVYDKGWKVRVDGHPTALKRGLGVFQSSEVAGGTHRVVFSFEPAYWAKGMPVQALGYAILVILWLFSAIIGKKKGKV